MLSNYVLKYRVWLHCVYRSEVMEQLIQSSDLFVMQVEMDVYTALKKVHGKIIYFISPRYSRCTIGPVSISSLCPFLSLQWMFLQLNPLWDGPIKQLLADADAWLCKRRTGTVRPHLYVNQLSSYAVFILLVTTHRCLTVFPIDCLQTCVRKSPSWTQMRARLFARCSNTFVSSISSTIWHLHASWRETIFCLLVRCGSAWHKFIMNVLLISSGKKTSLISLSSIKAAKWLWVI